MKIQRVHAFTNFSFFLPRSLIKLAFITRVRFSKDEIIAAATSAWPNTTPKILSKVFFSFVRFFLLRMKDLRMKNDAAIEMKNGCRAIN